MRVTIVLAALACFVGHGVLSERASAGEPFELVKGPDGAVYQLTPAQLKDIAASENPKPPCKIKDCLLISAYGTELQVPVKSLNAYIVPADKAKELSQELVKAGGAPLVAQWPPPESP